MIGEIGQHTAELLPAGQQVPKDLAQTDNDGFFVWHEVVLRFPEAVGKGPGTGAGVPLLACPAVLHASLPARSPTLVQGGLAPTFPRPTPGPLATSHDTKPTSTSESFLYD